MFREHSKNNRGYTLVELLITVALMGIIFGLGTTIFIQMNRFTKINTTKLQLQREARLSLNTINRNLRQAVSTSIVIDRATNQPYCSRLTFQRIDGQNYRFTQLNNKLRMESWSTTISTTTQVICNNVKYLAFVPPRLEDITMISVSVTLEMQIMEAQTKALHMASEKVMVMN